jgi:protein tyrosine phosphatase
MGGAKNKMTVVIYRDPEVEREKCMPYWGKVDTHTSWI